MNFSLWDPPLPVVPISSFSTDKDRLIGGRCWDLAAVQQALVEGSLSIELTTTATEGAANVGWRERAAVIMVFSFHESTR